MNLPRFRSHEFGVTAIRSVQRILDSEFGGDLRNRVIAIWADCDRDADVATRGLTALTQTLARRGACVQIHGWPADLSVPMRGSQAVRQVQYPTAALFGADALIVVGNSEYYREIDLGTLRWWLYDSLVIDCHRTFQAQPLLDMGIHYRMARMENQPVSGPVVASHCPELFSSFVRTQHQLS